ncbi:unnamed protein product [Trichogramma brassicae]|uniref:Uncharacterized protein n=1 Tax=Trichogramma brassicae TaxID=86971 RepID=A0A6H5HZP3_9HYME|nr:unnamed protein product [Trichogramma brassicae]
MSRRRNRRSHARPCNNSPSASPNVVQKLRFDQECITPERCFFSTKNRIIQHFASTRAWPQPQYSSGSKREECRSPNALTAMHCIIRAAMNNSGSDGTCFLTNVFSRGFPHRSHKIYFLDPPHGDDLSCVLVCRRKMRYLAYTRYRTLLRSICDICCIRDCGSKPERDARTRAPVYNEDCCVLYVSFFFLHRIASRATGRRIAAAPRQVLDAAAAARFYSISRSSIKNLANLIYSRTREIKSKNRENENGNARRQAQQQQQQQRQKLAGVLSASITCSGATIISMCSSSSSRYIWAEQVSSLQRVDREGRSLLREREENFCLPSLCVYITRVCLCI